VIPAHPEETEVLLSCQVSLWDTWQRSIKPSVGGLDVDLAKLERTIPAQGFRWLGQSPQPGTLAGLSAELGTSPVSIADFSFVSLAGVCPTPPEPPAEPLIAPGSHGPIASSAAITGPTQGCHGRFIDTQTIPWALESIHQMSAPRLAWIWCPP